MHTDAARLFVAIIPTEPVRETLRELVAEIPRVQWTPPLQIHLTLRFIGEQPSETREKIAGALNSVRVKTFMLGVEGIGGFPEHGDWQLIWTGVGRGHPLLHQLRQQIDDALLAAGIHFELRPFFPHLTLARSRDASSSTIRQWAKRHREFVGPIWPVSSFALMTSEASPQGAHIHHLVREYPLFP